ncbi:MAG: methionyl-tRNA formyltransferase [Clostridia bacterium]|nr:methionyl-tRNA formyltransferase [Clostridia bacterium]
MRIMFMGTPDFAAVSLEALIDEGYEVVCVISQPKKPKNRGMKLLETPVGSVAEQNGIRLCQPETLRDNAILPLLEEVKPDLIVVVAYGKLLPEYVLNYPKYGCINIHGSLLPKYRGAAPIQYSIIKGEEETGVTSMYMAKGMDTGDMIIKSAIPIEDDDTAETLHDKLAVLGAEVLLETVSEIEHGRAPRVPQNDAEATYASMLTKEMGKIDWEKSAREIFNLVRGLDPWPSAYSYIDGKRFKVFGVSVEDKGGAPGEILEVGETLLVGTGEGALRIREVGFDNKKRMKVSDFLRGNKDTFQKGKILDK